ncbi:hypothetical protein [Endozoicomonas sp. ALD040]|uniref:hypothetical protein n=1 Tax=Endozoicomonas sp. ALD040 TaxID=3403079 RepID=UPI003BB1A390
MEFEKNAGYPSHSFSIKHEPNTLPGTASDIVDTDGYAGSDEKRHRHYGYRVRTTAIESISWQWLYATNLMAAYELILITKGNLLISNPDLWLSVEVVAIDWLLKKYWNPDSSALNPIEQQVTPMLTQGDLPFATITTMFGSGDNQKLHPPSKSSGRRAHAAITQFTSSFCNPLYSRSGDGNEGPHHHSHTLSLNCFVHPCRGICRFRPSPDNTEPPEWLLNTLECSMGHKQATPTQSSCPHLADGHCFSCIDHLDSGQLFELKVHDSYRHPANSSNPADGVASGQMSPWATHTADATGPPNHDGSITRNSYLPFARTIHRQKSLSDHQRICGVKLVSEDGLQRPCGTVCKNAQALTDHKRRDHSGQQSCGLPVVGMDGLQRTCGKICKNIQALMSHKRAAHTGPQICNLPVTEKDGQPQPCGKLCKNSEALSDHKSRYHSRQQTCYVTMTGEDGQQRLCGKVCKNVRVLSSHKSRYHSGQQTCGLTLVGEDGQQRSCGAVCKNAQALSQHKRREHIGEQTCTLSIIGKDGLQRPCGKICKSPLSLASHRRIFHTGQKTCDVNVIGGDGLPGPCGKICKNAQALSDHKNRAHTKQKICEVTMIGEDGQQRPCLRVCMNSKALSYHKSRCHSEQKICYLKMTGEDGQQQPCGKICKNSRVLSDHKNRYHTGQQTCKQTVVTEDGQQQPCGKICDNIRALSTHRRIAHTGQKKCDVIVVGKDGQPQPCGKICRNAQALTAHKRRHRKSKHIDSEQNDGPGLQKNKVNK